jgi:multidrug resistance efflux pump
MSEEETSRRRYASATARARLDQARATHEAARAQLALLEAGAWESDLRVARAQVDQAKAGLGALDIELDRRVVRSPVEGVVLQKNVREGEFAPAGVPAAPLMLVGTTNPLHVRVDVDEHEAWRVREGARAVAFARGNKDIRTELVFVRFEPYIVPKRSLTGASTERVDTRVLQVIYSFDPSGERLFVGQQVDVFIEAESVERASSGS